MALRRGRFNADNRAGQAAMEWAASQLTAPPRGLSDQNPFAQVLAPQAGPAQGPPAFLGAQVGATAQGSAPIGGSGSRGGGGGAAGSTGSGSTVSTGGGGGPWFPSVRDAGVAAGQQIREQLDQRNLGAGMAGAIAGGVGSATAQGLAPQMPAWDPSILQELLAGGGIDPNQVGASYDPMIAAIAQALGAVDEAYGGARSGIEQAHLDQIAGIQTGLEEITGNIRSAADTASGNIAGAFEHAARMAQQGVPVVQEAGAGAAGGINSAYDTLAAALGAMPAEQMAAAAAAAGGVGNTAVAERAAAGAAPFAAAGEAARAGALGRASTTQQAGETYLNQIAAAAPADSARRVSAVEARSSDAIARESRAANERIGNIRTGLAGQLGSIDIARAQQQAELGIRQAELEGAQQRAMIEAAADVSGSTFDRMMQVAQLDASVQSPEMRAMFGLPPMSQSADPLDMLRLEGMQLGNENQRIQNEMLLRELMGFSDADPYTEALDVGGTRGFEQFLGSLNPGQRREAERFRRAIESSGVDPMAMLDFIDAPGPARVGSRAQGAVGGAQPRSAGFEQIARQIAAIESGEITGDIMTGALQDPMGNPVNPARSRADALSEEHFRQIARLLSGVR